MHVGDVVHVVYLLLTFVPTQDFLCSNNFNTTTTTALYFLCGKQENARDRKE